ncbi:hypothetical protein DFH06DRAFT_1185238, partial [Mycena polygramma]
MHKARRAGGSDLELVQAVVSAFLSETHQTAIPTTADVWRDFTPEVLDFLAQLARAPTTCSFDRFLDNGTIVESVPGDPVPELSCHNYIRRVPIPDGKPLTRYLHRFPATAPTTVMQLLLLGVEFDTNSFVEAMSHHGLEDSAIHLLDHIDTTSNPNVRALRAAPGPPHQMQLLYAGITWTVPAWERCRDDMAKKTPCMLVNFLDVNDLALEVKTYLIPSLHTRLSSVLDVRSNPIVSQKERILRAVLGSFAMNSSHGGNRPIFYPSPQYQQLHERALVALPTVHPFPLGDELCPRVQQEVRSLVDTEMQALELVSPRDISARALAAVKAKVADPLRCMRGKVVKLEITKDIPLEALNGVCGGYWDQTVGKGPQEDRHIRQFLHPAIPQQGDLSAEIISSYLGGFFDFWRLTLRHKKYWLHLLFTAHYLQTISPLLVVSQSSPVAAAIRSGDLVRCFEFLSPHTLDELLPTDLQQLLPEDTPPRALDASVFHAAIGTICLVPIGGYPSKMVLHIPRADSGRLKYDPELAHLRWRVDYLVTLIAEVVVQIVSAKLREAEQVDWENADNVKNWLLDSKEQSEDVLRRSGVTTALELAKAECRQVELVLTFLRSMTSSTRRRQEWLEGRDIAYERRVGVKTEQLDFFACQAYTIR